MSEDLRTILKKHALLNALKYDGKADVKAVVGKALSENPDLRKKAPEVFKVAEDVVAEINSMPLADQRVLAEALGVHIVKEKPKKEEHLLPPLPNVQKYSRVHVRFAPNPDSVIHLGNTRAALLSDEYAKMYRGVFILRFEDTSPSVKPPIPEAYEVIREDLRWLGVNWHEEYIQSERIPIYYEYAEKLIIMGSAYVCTCRPEEFRGMVIAKRPCPCRDLPPETHMKRWEGMLDGTIKKGGAVLRIKTDLTHPNPAIRDWPAMRIDTKPHPLQGKKYRVWPLYNFACGIDDHLMGITHILRGKEHEVNTQRQLYLYKYLGWEYPEAIHYGRLKIEGAILSKSKIRQGIESGIYKDWSDPRLGTIAALRKRGFLPETIRRLILEVGVKPSEAMISWDNLEAINRKLLDPITKRLIFVPDPVPLQIMGLPKEFVAQIPLHPDHPEWGNVAHKVSPSSNTIIVPSKDLSSLKQGAVFRLMNLFNVKLLNSSRCAFLSESVAEIKSLGAPIIQWLPKDAGTELSVIMPDAKVTQGLVDTKILNETLPSVFQFYRFGFVKVYREDSGLVGYYSHD
ncbi:MAG: glutamate--tRNA ligase [Candidatus Methanomethylicia archaeon]|jgi:glutamyl-tRNA synthetase|nr:glutamate--tRNA ligase [Candidatus Methanomethylicia archaeon]